MKNRLEELRKRDGKTQVQTAEIFSMQPTVYRRYEKGERELTINTALCIANYYKVSIDYLIMNEQENELNAKEIELIQHFNKLSEKQQTRILEEMQDYIEIENKKKKKI